MRVVWCWVISDHEYCAECTVGSTSVYHWTEASATAAAGVVACAAWRGAGPLAAALASHLRCPRTRAVATRYQASLALFAGESSLSAALRVVASTVTFCVMYKLLFWVWNNYLPYERPELCFLKALQLWMILRLREFYFYFIVNVSKSIVRESWCGRYLTYFVLFSGLYYNTKPYHNADWQIIAVELFTLPPYF